MHSINIIYPKYYDKDENSVSVGGIQTYITYLAEVIKSIGKKPVLFQLAKEKFKLDYNGMEIHGVCFSKNQFSKKVIKLIPKNEIVIFVTEELIVPYDGISIGIQHGISWDKPNANKAKGFLNNLFVFKRAYGAFKKIRKIEKLDKLICVDYNFLNWYRTQIGETKIEYEVIPNFTDIVPVNDKKNDYINIIFARRFFEYRGTRLFTKAILDILKEYNNVKVTVAGDGPDKDWLMNKLSIYDRVVFIKYKMEDSLLIHSDQHIAIIPTLGSEGTSLSLLEAMSAQCAVICTNIGGMTNVILNGFNGIMINPNVEQLYLAIKNLIDDKQLRNKLSKNAYITVKEVFSLDVWQDRWAKVLKLLLESNNE